MYPSISFCFSLLLTLTLGQQCPTDQVYYEDGCIPCTQPCNGEPIMCTLDCKIGCGCPQDYLYDNTGKCIPPTECPLTCSKKRIFYEALGDKCAPCIQTCESYLKGEALVCPKNCRTNVCECPEDYLTDALGNCITKAQCESKECENPGERFYTTKDGCAPREKTCKNVYQSDYESADECTTNICRCHLGYVRTDTNECIPVDKCPNTCPSGEVFYQGESCIECATSCDNWYHATFPCLATCKSNQCDCKPNFVRNQQGVCVSTSKCPTPICGPGERFYAEDECRNREEWCPNTSQTSISTKCENNVCACLEGYKRNGSNSCTDQCPV